MGLQRNARRHHGAIDPETWNDFAPGDKVMTIDRLPGVVVAVADGLSYLAELYEVVLDEGMGGGTYDAGELTLIERADKTAAADSDLPVVIGEYTVPQPVDDPNLHLASEDYPELGTILTDRPPLAHSEPLAMHASRTAAMIPEIPDDAVLQQFSQYPQSGSGIQYFKGEIDSSRWVDCLLAFRDGRLVGVLNYFGMDFPPYQKKGDVNLLVHPDYRHQGIGKSLWDEAKKRWGVSAAGQDTTPAGAGFLSTSAGKHDHDDGENDTGDDFASFEGPPVIQTEAGLWDSIIAPVVDHSLRYLEKDNPQAGTGGSWSYDWCRFRRDRHCYYPDQMDLPATQQAGYAVFTPVDRGICGRDSWEHQKLCPIAEPGPNSGDPDARLDATIPWSAGGQRGGVPVAGASLHEGRMQVEAAFEFTATWADVRKRATSIRSSGGVRIISATGSKDEGATITAEVKGSSSVYEAAISSEPGRKNVALWTCGCPWAAYSWGRSGRWKKYEGRMCAHALALTYEVQAKGMFGGTAIEDAETPEWSTGDVVRPGDYQRNNPSAQWAATASLRPVLLDGDLQPSVASWIARDMLDTGHQAEAVAHFGAAIVTQAQALDFKGRLKVLWNGIVKTVAEIFTEDATVLFTDGQSAPVRDVHYPTYHPSLGLTASLALDDDELIFEAAGNPYDSENNPYVQEPDQTSTDLPDAPDVPEPAPVPEPEEEPEAALPQTYSEDEDLTATGSIQPGDASLAWLMKGDPKAAQKGTDDIAGAAAAYLEKTALKDFSPDERKAIIDEGADVRTANFGSLDISGTHYEGLADDEDDDLDFA